MDPEIELSADELELLAAAAAGPIGDRRLRQRCVNLAGRGLMRPIRADRRTRCYRLTERGWAWLRLVYRSPVRVR